MGIISNEIIETQISICEQEIEVLSRDPARRDEYKKAVVELAELMETWREIRVGGCGHV